MRGFKSKAEELRYGERFGKQLDGLHKMDALAAAQAAVVKAAMDLRSTMHQVLIGIDDYMVVDHYSPEWQAYNAACADLKKLGG